MLNFCGIVAALLNMATGKKFSMSGINSGHHYLPTYKILMISGLWCPEWIPDIEKFLPVAIFKMVAIIPHKFKIVWFQCPELIPDIEKFLPVSIFKMAATKIQHCIWGPSVWCTFPQPLCLIVQNPTPEVTCSVVKGVSHILRGSKGVGVTIKSYGKVEISYINVDNF
jgi:hypothetical protein